MNLEIEIEIKIGIRIEIVIGVKIDCDPDFDFDNLLATLPPQLLFLLVTSRPTGVYLILPPIGFDLNGTAKVGAPDPAFGAVQPV